MLNRHSLAFGYYFWWRDGKEIFELGDVKQRAWAMACRSGTPGQCVQHIPLQMDRRSAVSRGPYSWFVQFAQRSICVHTRRLSDRDTDGHGLGERGSTGVPVREETSSTGEGVVGALTIKGMLDLEMIDSPI